MIYTVVGDPTPMKIDGGASRAGCSRAVTVASRNSEAIRLFEVDWALYRLTKEIKSAQPTKFVEGQI